MKPVIGILPLWDDEKDSLWMLPGYMEGIRQAGGLPVILPLTEDSEEIAQLVSMCSGLLFTGGHDVSPEIYHETSHFSNVVCCRARDLMEKQMLSLALERNLPILGICRGIQFLNAALGGTLYQHLPAEHPSDTKHQQKPPYDQPIHTVSVLNNSPLQHLLGKSVLDVNSYHHQAVRQLAPVLEPMALSPDGLVEAVYMPSKKYVWAVQWHPEFSYKTNTDSQKIFQSFVNSTLI